MTGIRWDLKPDGRGGWQGTLYLPLNMASLLPGAPPAAQAISAKGATKKQAIGNAAKLAEQVLDSPVLSAMLPPGAGLALAGAKALAKGKLGKVVGPGAKRLAKALGLFK